MIVELTGKLESLITDFQWNSSNMVALACITFQMYGDLCAHIFLFIYFFNSKSTYILINPNPNFNPIKYSDDQRLQSTFTSLTTHIWS